MDLENLSAHVIRFVNMLARVALVPGIAFLILDSARASAPPLGAPVTGPMELTAKPMILVFRALNPRDYANNSFMNPGGRSPINSVIGAVSNSIYAKSSAKVSGAIREAFPAFDVEHDLRAALRCGESGSLCSELAVLPETAPERIESDLRTLLKNRGWSDVRLLSFWWEQDGPRVAAHGAVENIRVLEDDKTEVSKPALTSYYLVAPPSRVSPKDPVPLPHADEWEPGAPLPREASLHTAVAELDPLLKLALSWNANNSRAMHEDRVVQSLTRITKYRDQGIECTGLRQCIEKVEGVVGPDRVWVWAIQRDSSDVSEYGYHVWELQSRPRVRP